MVDGVEFDGRTYSGRDAVLAGRESQPRQAHDALVLRVGADAIDQHVHLSGLGHQEVGLEVDEVGVWPYLKSAVEVCL